MTTGSDSNAAKVELAHQAGQFKLANDLTVTRLGFGAMRITGNDVWGEPVDRPACLKVLQRAVAQGVRPPQLGLIEREPPAHPVGPGRQGVLFGLADGQDSALCHSLGVSNSPQSLATRRRHRAH